MSLPTPATNKSILSAYDERDKRTSRISHNSEENTRFVTLFHVEKPYVSVSFLFIFSGQREGVSFVIFFLINDIGVPRHFFFNFSLRKELLFIYLNEIFPMSAE